MINGSDYYIKEFKTKVVDLIEEDGKMAAVLEETAFFPEGGGQSSDTGFIAGVRVNSVQMVNGRILHYIDEAVELGCILDCIVDWDIKYRKMQNHTGEHLFCGIIHNKYGYDNVGFHMNENEVVLDVNGELDINQLEEIELMANRAIYENQPVIISYPSLNEAAELSYRSKLELTEGIRLVEINNYDLCACCAPHVQRTGEIGLIKVIDSFYHRGGTRITIKAGTAAFEDYSNIDNNTRALMKLLSSKRYETASFAEALDKRYQDILEENKKLRQQITVFEKEKIFAGLEERPDGDNSPIIIFTDSLNQLQVRNIINELTERYPVMVAGFIGDDKKGYDYLIGRGNDLNLSMYAKELNAEFNGRGGGRPEMIQGHIQGEKEKIEKFINQP